MNPQIIYSLVLFVLGLVSYVVLLGSLPDGRPHAPTPVTLPAVAKGEIAPTEACVDAPKSDALASPPTGVSVAKLLEAAPSPLSGTGASPFGVNFQLPSNSVIDRMLEQAADAGIVWFRVELDWSYIEPKQGHFEWEDVDRLVDWAVSRENPHLALLSRTPHWASFSTNMAVPPQRGQDFVAFVRQVAARYRGRIQGFSIWNEPNEQSSYQGSQAFYIHEMLIPGLRALREAAPGALTVGPDLSDAAGVREQWLEPILHLVPSKLLDVVSQHVQVVERQPGQRLQEIDRFHRAMIWQGHGHKTLWVTETGLNGTSGPSAEVDQARLLRETMADMAKRTFWAKTFWQDVENHASGLLEPQAASGSGVPRLPYFAYRDTFAASGAPRPLAAPTGAASSATGPTPSKPASTVDQSDCLGAIQRLKGL